MRTGHDLLLGWVDTSPAALNEAGDAASVDAPAKFECDLARGESDFEPVRVSFFLFNLTDKREYNLIFPTNCGKACLDLSR